MKVLIFGGTRFFGAVTARLFTEAGHEVTLFTRGNTPALAGTYSHHVQGDRQKLEDLAGIGRSRWDVVIDNLAFSADDMALFLDAFQDVGHYLMTSTIAVYRYTRRPYPQPFKESYVEHAYVPPEEDLANVHWQYARGKLQAEEKLISQNRIAWTILRPPVVFGPGDPTGRGFWYVARCFDESPILLSDGGVQSIRLGYRDDVARAFFNAAQAKSTHGKIYHLAQEEIITLREYVEACIAAAGTRKEILNVPQEFLGSMAGPYGEMPLGNLLPDCSAAVHDFGYTSTPFGVAIEESVRWYVDNGHPLETELLRGRPSEIQFAAKWKHRLGNLLGTSRSRD